MKKFIQNTIRNNKDIQNIFPGNFADGLDRWLDKYFENEVHTSVETRKAQKRDIQLFLNFLEATTGNMNRSSWTLKTTRSFQAYLKAQEDSKGKPIRNERTINRIMAHLKTFAKWIHKLQPFTLFNPMLKIKISDSVSLLDVDNALSSGERIKMLEMADRLILEGAISKDKNRYKDKDRPRLKYKRPYRDRAIIYTLIETGMRRNELININIEKVNFKTRKIFIKGKITHKYQISKQGLKAIRDYVKQERNTDFDKWQSSVLFLSPGTVSRGDGKLTPCVINNIWNRVCKAAGVTGKTPHASRHAMGKYIMKKTGNPAAVRKQLGHTNPAYSLQYSRVNEKEIEDILNKR